MVVPACDAVMAQVPAETKVAVAPLLPPVVQTLVLVEAKVMTLPEAPPVATSATEPAGAKVWVGGGLKLITWVAWLIANVFVTSAATAYLVLPACDAMML